MTVGPLRHTWPALVLPVVLGGASVAMVVLTQTWVYIAGCLLLGLALLLLLRAVLHGRVRTVLAPLAGLAVAAATLCLPILVTAVRVDGAVAWHRDDLPQDEHSAPYVGKNHLVFTRGGRTEVVETSSGRTLSTDGADRESSRLSSSGDVYVESEALDGSRDVWRVSDGKRTRVGSFVVPENGTLDVIAAEDGYAAVRICPPESDTSATPTTCRVTGTTPDGSTGWSTELGYGTGYDLDRHPIPLRGFGMDPGTRDPVLLDPRTGSTEAPANPDLDPDVLMSTYTPTEPRSSSFEVDEAHPQRRLAETPGFAFALEDSTLFVEPDGARAWRQQIPGAPADQQVVAVANGQVVITSKPTAWSPYRSWLHPDSEQVTVLSAKNGTMLTTTEIRHPGDIHPTGGHFVLVSRGDGHERSWDVVD
ncbi:hypothetical protein [Brachybacterium endophyticum]|uniref:hypothetical protein n=1 Tax=Brachybacterium endophyticum TaxID=2182385 RepID=UPI001401BE00|nr:hypothetical protein [Brachybacterium endophyticum]